MEEERWNFIPNSFIYQNGWKSFVISGLNGKLKRLFRVLALIMDDDAFTFSHVNDFISDKCLKDFF